MKLSVKLSIIITAVVLVLFSVSLLVSYNLQVQFMREFEEIGAVNSLVSNCANVKKSVELQAQDYNRLVEQSIVQYLYSDFSTLIKDGNTYYSIATSDFFNGYTPLDPRGYFTDDDFTNSDTALKRLSDGMLVAHKFTVISELEFTAFLYRDMSEFNIQMTNLLISIIVISGLCMLLLIFVIYIIIKKTLKPVETLTKSAKKISTGNYSLRTNIDGNDEVATLSKAFDDMAKSIEEKVEFLKEEVEKRELFVAALSHEIKTPITSIIGYADSLKLMPLNETQKIDCANKIATAGRYMDKINLKIMELVGLSHNDEIEKIHFNTRDFCNAFMKFNMKININCDEIFGDETLIYSLVYNLLNNAFRYSDEVELGIDKDEKNCYITVKDKGCGIDKEKITLLTEAFYRVDKARAKKDGGLGLGLSICDKICKLHGGSLIIESVIGKGTTVTAKLQNDYNPNTD